MNKRKSANRTSETVDADTPRHLINRPTLEDVIEKIVRGIANDAGQSQRRRRRHLVEIYRVSDHVRRNPKDYKRLCGLERVRQLKRPPKTEQDVLRAMLQISFSDPKMASSYFKRLEFGWLNKRTCQEIEADLTENRINLRNSRVRQPDGLKTLKLRDKHGHLRRNKSRSGKDISITIIARIGQTGAIADAELIDLFYL